MKRVRDPRGVTAQSTRWLLASPLGAQCRTRCGRRFRADANPNAGADLEAGTRTARFRPVLTPAASDPEAAGHARVPEQWASGSHRSNRCRTAARRRGRRNSFPGGSVLAAPSAAIVGLSAGDGTSPQAVAWPTAQRQVCAGRLPEESDLPMVLGDSVAVQQLVL